jgi:hypothetical protein
MSTGALGRLYPPTHAATKLSLAQGEWLRPAVYGERTEGQTLAFVPTSAVRSMALRYQCAGRNPMSPYQARVVVPVLSVSVSSP